MGESPQSARPWVRKVGAAGRMTNYMFTAGRVIVVIIYSFAVAKALLISDSKASAPNFGLSPKAKEAFGGKLEGISLLPQPCRVLPVLLRSPAVSHREKYIKLDTRHAVRCSEDLCACY